MQLYTLLGPEAGCRLLRSWLGAVRAWQCAAASANTRQQDKKLQAEPLYNLEMHPQAVPRVHLHRLQLLLAARLAQHPAAACGTYQPVSCAAQP